jgi:putative membrane protein
MELMQRRFIDYAIISLKGLAMGAADVVPGVSGGTIAFISGIYEELITSLNNINLSLFKTLKKEGLKAAWNQLNGNFLLALFIGIGISVISLAKGLEWVLQYHPILIWSFFFGLVLASIFFVGKQIKKWDFGIIIGLISGAFVAFYITTIPSLVSSNSGSLFLFFAGALAICAMILPGISGAFILVLLGAYQPVLEALNNKDLRTILIIGLGAIVGLLSFSKLLKWLFKNYHNLTLAILTGFIIGSLNKIWPWKKALSFRTNSKGEQVPFLEESVSPFSFEGDNQLLIAIGLMVLGFVIIFILEKLGSKKQ